MAHECRKWGVAVAFFPDSKAASADRGLGRRSLTGLMALIACTITSAASSNTIPAQLDSAMPAADRQHHQRTNCHGAYDLLVSKVLDGHALDGDEAVFADAYEANANARRPCPAPPEELAVRAINRDIATQPAMGLLIEYVQQDDAAALFELGWAAAQGNVPGADSRLAFDTLEQAAELGDGSANYILGALKASGQLLGPKDETAALRHFLAGAAANHVDALFMAGLFHVEGVATRADAREGLEYLRRASEGGHVYATYYAANMANLGKGVKADHDLAYRLGRNLVDDGYVAGAIIAASALLQRRDVKQHQDEILHWMDTALRHGDANVQADMNRFRPQVVDLFGRMNAPPAYVPKERNLVCSQRTTCLVDSRSGLRSCTTNTDYWNGCRRLVY